MSTDPSETRALYVGPKWWYDLAWLKDRRRLLDLTRVGQTLRVDLRDVEWMDLQPLVDLLLHIDLARQNGPAIEVVLPGVNAGPGPSRTLRFLVDTGFLSALSGSSVTHQYPLTYIRDSTRSDPSTLLATIETQRQAMPPRAMKYAVLIPCTLVDADRFSSRLDVFDFCHALKREHLRGKPRQLSLSANLVYQIKIFLDSVLPELIDNVRVHKPTGARKLAVFSRLRKREERLFRRTDVIEAPWSELTDLNKLTQHMWQFDIAEAAFADSGPGIQDSWLSAWRRHNPSGGVPRLPESDTRVDGKNADAIILKGVFAENMSSLTPTERLTHDLPTVLTGLRSIREAIHSLDWHFSVRSGANYAVFSSAESGEGAPNTRSPSRRYDTGPGVHYLFRFADQTGTPLETWLDTVPSDGLTPESDWWSSSSPDSRAPFVTFQYEVPPEARPGDVVLCRPAHCQPKGLFLRFLREVVFRRVHLVFCDIPEPIALRLSLLIRDLRQYDALDLTVPIITNTWRLIVPGFDRRLATSFLGGGAPVTGAWWQLPGCTTPSVVAVMQRCREYDSRRFWDTVRSDPSAFLAEPVGWSDDIVLLGGYLSFANAVRIPSIRKIVRRSVVLAAHALRLSRVAHSSENVRHLANEVSRHLAQPAGTAKVGMLGSVRITGATMATARHAADAMIDLPVFQYPASSMHSSTGVPRPAGRVRALDWTPPTLRSVTGTLEKEYVRPRFSRLGRTGRIRIKPDQPLRTTSIQPADVAYRTWQRYDLVRVGHFSGSSHHHLVWLDLVTFLQGRSPESLELVAELATRIASFGARALFYEPNEATEELVELLRRSAADRRLSDFPRFQWPTSVVLDYSHLPTGNVGSITADAQPDTPEARAVFLDSVRVSGATSARVRAHLLALGYGEVLDVVILDRAQDVESDHLHRRIAWWTFSAPRLGSPRSCTLCRGISAIAAVAAHTQSDVFSSILTGWARAWTLGSDGAAGMSSLRDVALPSAVVRRLGVSQIQLTTHHALTAWTTELLSRLRHFSYVCERSDRPDAAVQTTVTATLLLHYWQDLQGAYQDRVFASAVRALWSEDDAQRRSLLVLALAALPSVELKARVDTLRDYLVQHGVPRLEVALAAHALMHMSQTDQPARAAYFADMRLRLLSTSTPRETPWRRGRAFLSLWTTSTGGEAEYRTAMRVIGIPGRGLEHAYLYSLLNYVAESSGRDIRSSLNEALALLEPVRHVVEQLRPVFTRLRVSQQLDRAFAAFSQAALEYRNRSDHKVLQRISSSAGLLVRYLSVEIQGEPSVRQVLASHYIHYVPLIIRESAAQLSAAHETIHLDDFHLAPAQTDAEQTAASPESTEAARSTAVQQLQELDVVCVDRSYLEQLVRDVLLDVKHPKQRNLRDVNGAYMSVEYSVEDGAGTRRCNVTFSNRIDDDDASAAQTSRSYTIAHYLASEIGGSMTQTFAGGTVRRVLTLPIFAASRKGVR